MRKRVIGVVSGKGGVGKTSFTINICAALTDMRKNVLAVDADLKMSGLALQLGAHQFSKTFNDVLVNSVSLYDSIYTHDSGLRIIPSSLSPRETSLFNMKSIFETPFFDDKIVMIDSPSGLERNVTEVIKSCTEIIVITTPDVPSIANAMKVISKSRELGIEPLGVVVNMYDKRDPNRIDPNEIGAICEAPVIGVIPHDKIIRKSIFRKTPAVFMNPYSPASVEYKKIAAKLYNQDHQPDRFLRLKRVLWGLKK